ncbi:MAG TPA: hypothetical protein VGN57_13230 [Pirellulaceae bacterium]|nr:hypothetical protein [Pirellulaceae bacterium]
MSRPTLAFAVTMHRSGSSVTMNVLQALGASLGPYPLNGASTGNKYGHFESMPLLMLDREVLFAAHGYRDEELFQSPELMSRFRQSQGDWASPDLSEEWLRKGSHLISRLAESGDVVAFKDPRVPLIWPFWKTLLEELTGVRVVLLFLVRAPHAIAMSIYSRSGGEIPYDAALDATEGHLRQMIRIRDAWQGESALVRFQGEEYFVDLQSAATLCGLDWSDEIARQVVDPKERHQRAAYIDHPAQRLFEELAGQSSRPDEQENQRILQQDAIKREAVLRRTMHDWRAKAGALSEELNQLSSSLNCSNSAEIASTLAALREEIRSLRACLESERGASYGS